ncbi:hypothetical protein CF319_g8355 [Tilletia indica]|nr:hypothetical protein CF319_g8355 [Tilletia indica]
MGTWTCVYLSWSRFGQRQGIIESRSSQRPSRYRQSSLDCAPSLSDSIVCSLGQGNDRIIGTSNSDNVDFLQAARNHISKIATCFSVGSVALASIRTTHWHRPRSGLKFSIRHIVR